MQRGGGLPSSLPHSRRCSHSREPTSLDPKSSALFPLCHHLGLELIASPYFSLCALWHHEFPRTCASAMHSLVSSVPRSYSRCWAPAVGTGSQSTLWLTLMAGLRPLAGRVHGEWGSLSCLHQVRISVPHGCYGWVSGTLSPKAKNQTLSKSQVTLGSTAMNCLLSKIMEGVISPCRERAGKWVIERMVWMWKGDKSWRIGALKFLKIENLDPKKMAH